MFRNAQNVNVARGYARLRTPATAQSVTLTSRRHRDCSISDTAPLCNNPGRRSRVNFFMNKFRKLGPIEYTGGPTINSSHLRVVLHDRSTPAGRHPRQGASPRTNV